MPYSPLVSKIRVHNPNKKGASSANRNYVTYIATREGVSLEKVHSINDLLNNNTMMETDLNEELIHQEADNKEYIEYMARRPRSQGLFGNINVDNLKEISSEIAALTRAGKIIYRGIISLSEKDAQELGFRNVNAWNNYLTRTMPDIAEKLGISSFNHTWIAAFHAEEKHPHVHYMLWDNQDKVKSPFIYKATQQKIRIYLETEMFDNEYEQAVKLALKAEFDELNSIRNIERKAILEKTGEMMKTIGYVPGIEYEKLPSRVSNEYLQKIAEETRRLIMELPGKGSFKYQYLPHEAKTQLNKVVGLVLQKGDIQNSFERYLKSVEKGQQLQGHTKTKIQAEIEKAKGDVQKRIANKILSELKGVVLSGKLSVEIEPMEYEADTDILVESDIDIVEQENDEQGIGQETEKEYKTAVDEEAAEPITQKEPAVTQEPVKLAPGNRNQGKEQKTKKEYQDAKDKQTSTPITPEELAAGQESDNLEQENKEEDRETENKYYISWDDGYKEAAKLIYGITPDIPKAVKKLELLIDKGNVLALFEKAKLIDRQLADGIEKEECLQYYKEAFLGFNQVYMFKNDFYLHEYAAYRIGKFYSWALYPIEEADYEQARVWFERAGDNKYALYSLGKLYLDNKIFASSERDIPQNQRKAFNLFHKATDRRKETPNPFAAYELGNMYRQGIATEVNNDDSQKYYKIALKKFIEMSSHSTDDGLFYTVGQMYIKGLGTDKDQEKGQKYIERAAELGNEPAKLYMAKIYFEKDDDALKKKAIKILEELAENDSAMAQYRLGVIYANKENVGYYNLPKAIKYLEASAEQENQFAQYKLGTVYANRENMEYYNMLKAIKYLEASAEQENQFAQYKLGTIYANRENIEYYNMLKAIKYLEASAEQKNQFAQYKLGTIYVDRENTDYFDMSKAIKYLEASAEQGNQFAQCKIGELYYFGKDVTLDKFLGRYWLEQAAAQGNEFAKNILDNDMGIGMDFSYCLLKASLSALETLNRQAEYANNELAARNQSKQAQIDHYLHRDNQKEENNL